MTVSIHEARIASLYRREVDNQAINQRAMAQDINVSPQLLSHMLNGRRAMGLERVIDIADYLQDPDLDFDVAAELLHTPTPIHRKRRDNHPLSKMVGQDKEESQRIEAEKKYEIWDLLTIDPSELLPDKIQHLKEYWYELSDEIRLELSVLTSMCNRFNWNMRTMLDEADARERND